MASNWQSNTKSLKDRATVILREGTFSDVIMNVGQGDLRKSFKCHALLLAMSSKVFEQMFYGELAVQEKEGQKEVDIIDIEPDIFQKLLSYLYKDKLELENAEDAILLHTASNKYMIDDLTDQCLQYLMQSPSSSSAIIVLEYAYFTENTQLKSGILYHIATNADFILNSNAFLNAKVPTVISLLKDCNFKCSEVVIINAILNYAMMKVSKDGIEVYEDKLKAAKEYLISNDILKGIKISSLTPSDFIKGVKPVEFFTCEERLQILGYIDKCSLDLPPYLNANHQRTTEEHDRPQSTTKDLRSLLVTPTFHQAEVKLDIVELTEFQGLPCEAFECNMLVNTTVDAFLRKIKFEPDDYSRFETQIEIFAHYKSCADLVFKGTLFEVLEKARLPFRAGTPYVWKMKFKSRRCDDDEADDLCYRFQQSKVAQCYGVDLSIGTVTVETSGWFPGYLGLVFCTQKVESALDATV